MTSVPPPDEPSRQQPPPHAPSSPSSPSLSSFFRWIRGLGVTRTPERWIGGVSGAVAHRTGLDLALVRGLIVVLTIFGGIGILLYGVAWALLPEPDGRIHAEQAVRGTWTSGMTGATAFVVLGLLGPGIPLVTEGNGAAWTLFWVGGAGLFVYWIVNRSSGSGPAGAPGDARPDSPGGGPAGGGGSRPGGDGTPGRPGAPGAGSSTGPSTDRPSSGGTPGFGTASGAADRGGAQGRADAPLPHPLPYRPSPELAAYRDYSRPAQVPLHTEPGRAPSRSVTARRTQPSGATTALLLGAAATTAGTLLVLDRAGILVLPHATVVALAAATVVLGLGVIGLGLRGRSSGLVGFTAALTLLSAVASSFAVVGGTWVVAQEGSSTPSSLRTAADGYSVLASQSPLDLRGLPRPERDVVVPVGSLVSDVTVLVPDDVPVEVRFRSVLGQADVVEDRSSTTSGGNVLDRRTEVLNTDATGATLIVDARNALGQVTVLTGAGADAARDGGTP
ncbi:hypothetical protein AC792_03535 [Arthrobacter sp. RIT-PI-e]|uniref:PspC domain-containing protein n=1 Tax=Arthrobacter sp. RIT-PI-e TaxID=1681197 RepID=UPI0006769C94|nr:PspC domain-containing protein [Arthrobacter sp. RIT-PI-e]KNC19949.1 hypothetical protein AC792_03535 [Arthrobacter sp. RIT-PI-e]